MGNKTPQVRRRDVLKSAGIGAISTAPLARVVDGADRVEVVVARGGLNDEPRLTEEVPAKWYSHAQAMDIVRDRLSRQLRSYKFVNGCRLVSSNRMVGDIKYSQIEVTVAPQTSDDELASLPSTLKGAGVSVPSDVVVTDLSIAQESAHLTPHDCDDNKNNDTPFPSGYFVKADYGDTFAIGTSGYRVYDNGVGEERMLMANHVMTADCSAGDGKDLFDHNGNVIGTGTSKYHKGVDWILIDPQVSLSNSNYPDGAIWADGMDSHSGKFAVDGWVTKYGSKVIRDQDKVVENYGSTTGYDSGYIDAINVSKGNGCVNLFENGVKVSCDSGSGDSGGPVWFDDPTDGKVYIIGHISLGKKDKTITCDGEDIKYGNISVFYPFFRIKDSNPAFVLGDDQYG